MGKAGHIIGFIGAILMVIGGLVSLNRMNQLEQQLVQLGTSFASLGIDIDMINMNFLLTLIFGLIGVVGAIIGLAGKKVGSIILLGGAILAVVGTFITIAPAKILTIGMSQLTFPAITLSSSFLMADPYLMLIGGIIGVTSSTQKGEKSKDKDKDAWNGMTKKLKKSRAKWQKKYG